jgi:hypothetical protein
MTNIETSVRRKKISYHKNQSDGLQKSVGQIKNFLSQKTVGWHAKIGRMAN